MRNSMKAVFFGVATAASMQAFAGGSEDCFIQVHGNMTIGSISNVTCHAGPSTKNSPKVITVVPASPVTKADSTKTEPAKTTVTEQKTQKKNYPWIWYIQSGDQAGQILRSQTAALTFAKSVGLKSPNDIKSGQCYKILGADGKSTKCTQSEAKAAQIMSQK